MGKSAILSLLFLLMVTFGQAQTKIIEPKEGGAKLFHLKGDASSFGKNTSGLAGIDYHFDELDKDINLVHEAHEKGLLVNVWTVNDPVVMKRMFGLGVDYLTTDTPALALQVQKEYAGKYSPANLPQVDLRMFKKDKKGFVYLFDGTSLRGWRNYGKESLSPKWRIDDGALMYDTHVEGTAGDAIFSHAFKNYELEFEWKISKAGNSGVLYFSQEIVGQYAAASSPEFQVLDNENHPDAKLGKDGNRQAASLYDLIPANPQKAKPYGEWNSAKIVVDHGTVTHYQNGKKVLSYTLWTPEWTDMLAKSKFTLEEWEDAYYLMPNTGGINREGYIVLQDHGNDVWYRNMRIREIR